MRCPIHHYEMLPELGCSVCRSVRRFAQIDAKVSRLANWLHEQECDHADPQLSEPGRRGELCEACREKAIEIICVMAEDAA